MTQHVSLRLRLPFATHRRGQLQTARRVWYTVPI